MVIVTAILEFFNILCISASRVDNQKGCTAGTGYKLPFKFVPTNQVM